MDCQVKEWTREYTFTPDGKVTWRDPLNNENGSGRWAIRGNLSTSPALYLQLWIYGRGPLSPLTNQGGTRRRMEPEHSKRTKSHSASLPPPREIRHGCPPGGPDYTQQADYVDNVVSGEYDPASGRFVVKHSDELNIELDIQKSWLAQPSCLCLGIIVEMYVFYRKEGRFILLLWVPTPLLISSRWHAKLRQHCQVHSV